MATCLWLNLVGLVATWCVCGEAVSAKPWQEGSAILTAKAEADRLFEEESERCQKAWAFLGLIRNLGGLGVVWGRMCRVPCRSFCFSSCDVLSGQCAQTRSR